MSSHLPPNWADPDKPLYEVVAAARDENVATESLVDILQQERFPDAPARRVQRIVEATADVNISHEGPTADSASGDSRISDLYGDSSEYTPGVDRRLDLSDLRDVTRGEFAELCRPLLERFDGNTIVPHHPTVDVLWHRQHGTVGIHVIPGSPEDTLSVEQIRNVADADTTVDNHRSPSQLVIVTPRQTDDEVSAAATEMDITLVGAPRLAQWFRITPLTPNVVGDILENSHSSEFEVAETIEALPPLPPRWADADPLLFPTLPEAHVDAGTSVSHPDSRPQPSISSTTDKRASGETDTTTEQTGTSKTTTGTSGLDGDSNETDAKKEYGTLYADPSEDGDYDGIDAWADGINTEDKR